jgi:hypothetical protein
MHGCRIWQRLAKSKVHWPYPWLGYYYETKSYELGLYPEELKRYVGKSYLLVARKKTDAVPFEKDTNITFSRPYPITQDQPEFRAIVDLSKQSLHIGIDRVEADVFIVPNDLNLENIA